MAVHKCNTKAIQYQLLASLYPLGRPTQDKKGSPKHLALPAPQLDSK